MEGNKEKLKLKKLLGIVSYSVKLGFSISKTFYTLKFIDRLLQVILPILEALIGASLLAEIVKLINLKQTLINSNIIIFLILEGLFITLRSLSFLLEEFIRMRFNYIFTEKMFAKYISRLAELDMQDHENPDFKTLLIKVEDVLNWRGIAIMDRITGLTTNIVGLTLLIYIFFQVNWLFLIIMLIPVIISFFVNKRFGRNVYDIWEWEGDEFKEATNSYSSLKDNSIIAESKIYGFGDFLAQKFTKVTKKYTKRLVKGVNQKYRFVILITFLEQILFSIIQLDLIIKTLAGDISILAFSFYIQTIGQVSNNFSSIEGHLSQIYEFSLYMRDFKYFLEMPAKIHKPLNGIKVKQEAPTIEFKNVSFKYPNSDIYVVKNLSFKIDKGERVALVGENGAGKTTIIKLLARFYDVCEGEILINGINIKEIDITEYYRLWGVLFQYFAKYWFSLKENIGIGNIEDMDNITLIQNAAEKAGLNKVINKLPNKLDNMLSTDFKDGKDLSGGEWQKVGLARGFFANPKLIILDEPTSALDAIAEQEIFDEIQKISTDTTMIIVSHRFATVRNANKILILENGEISEEGTHEQLMNNKGLYFKMFTTQAEGYI